MKYAEKSGCGLFQATASVIESKPKRRSKRRNRCIMPVALVSGCLIMINATLSVLITQHSAPQVVAFDMKGTLDAFMDQSAQQALSNEATTELTGRFSRALNASLSAWQAEHHALVLVSPAVVVGAPDVTKEIQQLIAERMRGDMDE